MTLITINEKPIHHGFKSEQTLNELIDITLEHMNEKNHIITKIIADGSVLHLDQNNEMMIRTIGSFSELNLTTQSSLDLAFDALDSCTGYVDIVLKKITQIISSYSAGEYQSANAHFAEVIEIMDLFIQLMTKIHRTIRIHQNSKTPKATSIQQLEIHLLSILKALIPAKEKNDIIMLCDLLEYELMDNLRQWKIAAIPELKKFKTT